MTRSIARGCKIMHLAVALVMPAAIVLAGVVNRTSDPAAAGKGGNPNPRIHPSNSKPYGQTYGEWSAHWWQWILSIPRPINPNLDLTGQYCGEGQSGHVWFLPGGFGGPPPIRTCRIPTGVSILMTPSNTAFGAGLADCLSPPPFNTGPCDVAELRKQAAAQLASQPLGNVFIDDVLVADLASYRFQSPVFAYSQPPDSVVSFLFGVPFPPGTYAPAVSDGYWLMLNPLPAGTHTVRVEVDGVIAASTTIIVGR